MIKSSSVRLLLICITRCTNRIFILIGRLCRKKNIKTLVRSAVRNYEVSYVQLFILHPIWEIYDIVLSVDVLRVNVFELVGESVEPELEVASECVEVMESFVRPDWCLHSLVLEYSRCWREQSIVKRQVIGDVTEKW